MLRYDESDKQKMPADSRTGIERRIVLRPVREVKAQTAESSSSLALGNQLANGGNQFVGNFHDSLGPVFKRGLVLRDGFVLRLLFMVSQDFADALFVPARGGNLFCFFMSVSCVYDADMR